MHRFEELIRETHLLQNISDVVLLNDTSPIITMTFQVLYLNSPGIYCCFNFFPSHLSLFLVISDSLDWMLINVATQTTEWSAQNIRSCDLVVMEVQIWWS